MDHIVEAIVELLGSGRGRDKVLQELHESLEQNESQLRLLRSGQMPSEDDLNSSVPRLGKNVALYRDAIANFDEGGGEMDASLKATAEKLEKLSEADLLKLIDDQSGGGLRKKRTKRRKSKKRTRRRKSKKRTKKRKSRKHK